MSAFARTALLLSTLSLSSFVGCATAPTLQVDNQLLTAACGMCLYAKPTGQGCYWVVEIDGETYPMAGELPRDHQNHAPDGMCNMKRQARISGALRGENFIATQFDLLPAESPPAVPTYTEADIH